MAEQAPMKFVFYIAAPMEKVWEGFVGEEANRAIFSTDFEIDLKPGGSIAWVGKGQDGKRVAYVHGEVIKADPPKFLQYTFAIGPTGKFSRVTVELTQESEATKVVVTHDRWAEDDTMYAPTTDGWPRILSRLKTLIETGKTFKPH